MSRLVPLLALAAGCTGDDVRELLGIHLYVVQLDVAPEEVRPLVDEIASQLDVEVVHVYERATQGFSVWLPEAVVDEVASWDGVASVELDEGVPYEPPDGETDIVVGAGEVPVGIERIGGPYQGSVDLGAIAVAVVDTGVDSSHPELDVAETYDAVCETTGDCADGGDPNGHGTHVAGTIAARADGDGVAGVLPGVPIYAVRVLGSDGSGYLSDIVAGLEWVLDHPEVRVVNMSLGGTGSTAPSALSDAIAALEEAGVLVAIAAGNEATDTSGVVPAGYDLGVVVSAYDCSDGDQGFAWFSNYGDAVDVAAPGVDVESTWPRGGYARLDGTSMATPHVAGAAAVAMALDPGLDAATVREAIVASAESVAGQGGEHPEGLLDLPAMLDRLGL